MLIIDITFFVGRIYTYACPFGWSELYRSYKINLTYQNTYEKGLQ
jgi:hypothetical protein